MLRRHKQLAHRRLERKASKRARPAALSAIKPNQVASWDITYLPTAVRGQHWYLYAVMDLFSRKIVAWQVYETESGEHASGLIRDYVLREAIAPNELTLHSDNGAAMKGATLYATLQTLGIATSHSRPSVSDDNAFIESFFRTLKYRPNNAVEPFATYEFSVQYSLALGWLAATQFPRRYNQEHRHSAISFVTPNERHSGEDIALLAQRKEVYEQARARNPNRWSGQTRNWKHKAEVNLNPHRVEQVHA